MGISRGSSFRSTRITWTGSFNDLDFGGRLCTCLLYLNDQESMESSSSETGDCRSDSGTVAGGRDASFTGGETNFPEFNRAVSPKKGSALFFWNTLERPGSKNYNHNMFLNVDTRLRHAGTPFGTRCSSSMVIH